MSAAVDRLFSVAGKRVLITGGTRGVGMMIARTMSEAGAELIVASRKPEACEAAAAELGCPVASRRTIRRPVGDQRKEGFRFLHPGRFREYH